MSNTKFYGRRYVWLTYLVVIIIGAMNSGYSQKKKIALKDSADHRLDMSDWVLSARGFLPVPTIIT